MSVRTPLDDVEFLARSAHRVEVLRTLRSGPWTRPALHDETGISQPTLGRVLASLEERHWVERAGREYALTAVGALVAAEFEDLLETVETAQRLGEVVAFIPIEELGFDVRRFGDATVMTPSTGDTFRHVRRIEDLVYGSENLRLLSTTVAPGTVDDNRKRYRDFLASEQVVESVITADTLEQTLENPELAAIFTESVASGRVRLYRYEGAIPHMVGVADGTAFVVPFNDQGFPAAVIESTDETIRAWAEATIDEYVAASTPLTVDTIGQ